MTLYIYSVHWQPNTQVIAAPVLINQAPVNLNCVVIAQFRYIKIQLKTIDLRLMLRAINPTNSVSSYSPVYWSTVTTQFLSMTIPLLSYSPWNVLPSFFRWHPSGHFIIKGESQLQRLETIVHHVLLNIAK